MSSKQYTEYPEEVVSNADTGYETSSIVSASSSSEISKVRYNIIILYSYIGSSNSNDLQCILAEIAIKVLAGLEWASSLTMTHACTHTHTANI
jgi:hypothetical protein